MILDDQGKKANATYYFRENTWRVGYYGMIQKDQNFSFQCFKEIRCKTRNDAKELAAQQNAPKPF